MFTNNCLYCEKVCENMKGKLVIEVKVPDGETIFDYVQVSQNGGLFNVKLGAGSTYIYNIQDEMEIYAHLSSDNKKRTECIKIIPDEFYHIIIDYEYFYYQNQPRIEKLRWQKVEHITHEQLYDR